MLQMNVAEGFDGIAIVIARRRKNMKAQDLAIAVGISSQKLSRMELGRATIPEQVAIAIARELGISIEVLRITPEAKV